MIDIHESYRDGWAIARDGRTDALAIGVETPAEARQAAESYADGVVRNLDDGPETNAIWAGAKHRALAGVVDDVGFERVLNFGFTAEEVPALVRYALDDDPLGHGRKLTKRELLIACDRLGVEAVPGMRRETIVSRLAEHFGYSDRDASLTKPVQLDLYHALREVDES